MAPVIPETVANSPDKKTITNSLSVVSNAKISADSLVRFSVKDRLKQENATVEIPKKQAPIRSFSSAFVTEFWEDFKQKNNLPAHLHQVKIDKKDEGVLEVEVSSNSLKVQFERYENQLITEFCKATDNTHIDLQFRIDVKKIAPSKSKKELFEEMLTLNPHIAQFDQFTLDFN